MLLMHGRIADAERELRVAKVLTDRHARGVTPGWVTNWKIVDSECAWLLGRALNSLRRPLEADVYLREAQRQLVEVTTGFPTFHWARYVLAKVYLERSSVLLQLHREAEAMEQLLQCERNCDYERGATQGLSYVLTDSLFRQGQLLCWNEQRNDARRCFEETKEYSTLVKVTNLIPDDRCHGNIDSPPNVAAIRFATFCPQTQFRDAALALEEAMRSFQPERGLHWQLLGVGQLRAGLWQEARQSFEQSIRRRNGGDAFDHFLLAMTNQQLGDRESALECYRKAVANVDGPLTYYTFTCPRELNELRDETETILGIGHDVITSE
jgi:tetratricopeptide (TPR) repeat protein